MFMQKSPHFNDLERTKFWSVSKNSYFYIHNCRFRAIGYGSVMFHLIYVYAWVSQRKYYNTAVFPLPRSAQGTRQEMEIGVGVDSQQLLICLLLLRFRATLEKVESCVFIMDVRVTIVGGEESKSQWKTNSCSIMYCETLSHASALHLFCSGSNLVSIIVH